MTKLDSEGNVLADESPCAGVRADLKNCLLDSDCVKKKHKTPRECLASNDCPTECQALRNAFFECKRSLVCTQVFFVVILMALTYHYIAREKILLDTRQRFRGRKGY